MHTLFFVHILRKIDKKHTITYAFQEILMNWLRFPPSLLKYANLFVVSTFTCTELQASLLRCASFNLQNFATEIIISFQNSLSSFYFLCSSFSHSFYSFPISNYGEWSRYVSTAALWNQSLYYLLLPFLTQISVPLNCVWRGLHGELKQRQLQQLKESWRDWIQVFAKQFYTERMSFPERWELEEARDKKGAGSPVFLSSSGLSHVYDKGQLDLQAPVSALSQKKVFWNAAERCVVPSVGAWKPSAESVDMV